MPFDEKRDCYLQQKNFDGIYKKLNGHGVTITIGNGCCFGEGFSSHTAHC